jgi:hypothetical protein
VQLWIRATGPRSPRRAAAAGAVAALAATVLAAAPAAAASDVVLVTATSATSSTDVKSVTAHCPAGTSVTNAGGDVTGGAGDVVIDDLFPNEALTSVTATGIESHAYGSLWSITAYATCAPTPDGLEWVWEQSATDSDWAKDVSAECTDGNVLWGTGATIEGGDGDVAIDEIVFWGPEQVTVEAYELGGSGSEVWNVNAFAICAEEPAGYQQEYGTDGPYDGDPSKFNLATCPSGLAATGHGAELSTFDKGQIIIDKLNATPAAGPSSALTEAFDADVVAGTSDYWSLRAFAICADV